MFKKTPKIKNLYQELHLLIQFQEPLLTIQFQELRLMIPIQNLQIVQNQIVNQKKELL